MAYLVYPCCTNNQAEYEAVFKGIQLLHEVKAEAVEIFGDSLLVVDQLIGKYECSNDVLKVYLEKGQQLLEGFIAVTIEHIPKTQSEEANRLAQSASGYRQIFSIMHMTWLPMIGDEKLLII